MAPGLLADGHESVQDLNAARRRKIDGKASSVSKKLITRCRDHISMLDGIVFPCTHHMSLGSHRCARPWQNDDLVRTFLFWLDFDVVIFFASQSTFAL